MKNFKRLLCVLLCLCMLPGVGQAEFAVEAAEEVVIEMPIEAPEEPAESTPEETPAVETEPTDTVETDISEPEEVAFDAGYADARPEAPVYEQIADAEPCAILAEGGVVYALESRAADDRDFLYIVFALEDGIANGWIAADDARMLTAEESASFAAACDPEQAVYVDGDPARPLAAIVCVFAEQPDDAPVGEEMPSAEEELPVENLIPEEVDLPEEVLLPEETELPEEVLLPQENLLPEEDETLMLDSAPAEDGEQTEEENELLEEVLLESVEFSSGAQDETLPESADVQNSAESEENGQNEDAEQPVEDEITDSEEADNTESGTEEDNGEAVLVVEAAPLELYRAAEMQLTAEQMFGMAPEGEVVWSVEGDCIAVSAEGLLSAIEPGTAVVVATADGITARAEVTVLDVVLTISASEAVLGVNEKLQLKAEFSDGTTRTVKWSTSASRQATVSTKGLVRGVRVGEAVITAEDEFGHQAQCTVTVKKAPSKVTMTPSKRTLGVGEMLQLNVSIPADSSGAWTYSGYSKSIVSVTEDGLVTALKPGRTTVYVRTYNSRRASCVITVKAAPESVELNAETLVLGEEQTFAFAAALNKNSGGSYAFASDDPQVLSIDPATGLATAHKPGPATVRVETYNGKSDTCTVTVKPAPKQITVVPGELVLGVNEKSAPLQVIYGADEMCSYTFESLNKRYATVDAKGVVKGVRVGETAIRVTTHNGVSFDVAVTVKKAPYKVTVSPAKQNMGVGETLDLKVTLSAGSSGAVRFDKYNSKIVSVSDEGTVTALAAGTTKVRAIAYNNRYAYFTVTVKAAPESIELNRETLVLGVGETFAFTAKLNAGSAGAYSYSALENAGVISVDPSSGMVTALKTGTAIVQVETYNHKTDLCAVEVKPAPEGVNVLPEAVTLGVGEYSESLDIELVASGECAGSYEILTSNKRYATVGSDGRIKGVRAGSAVITVETYNGQTDTVAVTVRSAPYRVTLNHKTATLGVNETLQLTATLPARTAGEITFTSSDENVLAVDQNGLVTAVGEGSAQITAKTYNGRKAVCKITVKKEPTSLTLANAPAEMGAGEKFALNAALSAGSAGKLTFTSSNPSAVKVDAAGKLTAVAAGEATIRVETYNGLYDTCDIVVKNAPTGIEIREASITVAVGDTFRMERPVVLGDNAGCGGITYTSGSKKYMTVDADGLVKGVRAGTVTLTVKTYNNKKDSIKVYVKAAPKSVSFDCDALTLAAGKTYRPEITFNTQIDCSYRVTTSDASIVALEADGRTLRAVAPGTATVRVTTYNNKTDEIVVTVPQLPESIDLIPAELVMGKGDSIALAARMPAGQDSLLTFATDNAEAATVDAAGNVNAVEVGTAVISVDTVNGKHAESRITVVPAPTLVRLAPRSALRSLEEGALQLDVSFGSAEEGGRVLFSSSDPAIASVSGTGLVTFHATGTVQITAVTYNGYKAISTIEIAETPTGMRFAEEEFCVALGDTVQMPVVFENGGGSYTISVGDGSVAAADGDRVKALSIGSTTLKAVSWNGLEAESKVTVVEAPSGIEISQTEAELYAGATLQMTATVLPHGVGSYTFASSDPAVAVVDEITGLVRAVGKGECTISVTTYDGRCTAVCALKVNMLLEGVRIGIDPGHQAKGDMSQEQLAPGSSKLKFKVSWGAAGVSTRIAEHVTNLQVSLQLRDALEALGAEVYMTRETADVNISNKQRALMMNECGVDLVLRIHGNSTSNRSLNGASTWVRNTGTAKEECWRAGQDILDGILAATGARDDGMHKSDNYTGLNWSTVPCVLVEMGYLSNSREDRLLNSPEYQAKLVKGMVNGICVYMGRPMPEEIEN